MTNKLIEVLSKLAMLMNRSGLLKVKGIRRVRNLKVKGFFKDN